jgi:hypothetical protein
VASTVHVQVTMPADVDIDRTSYAPPAVLAVVAAAGQPTSHGFTKSGDGPWRASFQIRGQDRISTARALERRFRELGYEADAIFSP